jgi:hypothetical protein
MVMVVVSVLFGAISGGLLPQLASEYENPALFRPWSDPLMSLFFLYPFILAVALTFVWMKTKPLFSGKTRREKAIRFGVTYWLLTNSMGMLISYSTFPISLAMVISWSLSSLLVTLAGAWVIVTRS